MSARSLDRLLLGVGAGVFVAVWIAWAGMLWPGDHLPAGDGPHLLAAAWRLSDSARPLDDLLHRVVPHPPLAYLPTALLLPVVGVRASLVAVGGLSLLALAAGLRLLRPDAAWGAVLAGAALVGAGGCGWWAVDQGALDLPAAALTVLALGMVQRAGLAEHRDARLGLLAGVALLVAVFTKYTAALPVAGGVLAALAMGAFRRRETWIAAGVCLLVGVPWLAFASGELSAYSAASVGEAVAGGAAGTVNHDPEVALSERLSVARLRRWGQAARDTLGIGAWAVVVLGVAMQRARHPGARVALVAAFLPLVVLPLGRVQPQPRYLLPVAALGVAAALPGRRGRLVPALMAAVAVVGVVFGVSLYRGVPAAERPGHRSAVSSPGLGGWPWPAAPLWPVRSRTDDWGAAGAVSALDEAMGPADTAAIVRFGADPDRPGVASFDLVARQLDIRREWVVAESPRGALPVTPGMQEPTWAWVSWTEPTAGQALRWIQSHADLEGAQGWWTGADGQGAVVVPLGAHQH